VLSPRGAGTQELPLHDVTLAGLSRWAQVVLLCRCVRPASMVVSAVVSNVALVHNSEMQWLVRIAPGSTLWLCI
jgi:hypothetical protein